MAIQFTWTETRDEVVQLIRPELEIAFNEADLDPRVEGSVLEALGFVTVETRLPQHIVTRIGSVSALPKINENGDRPRQKYSTGDEKGYRVEQYGWSYGISKLAMKVIKDSGLDTGLLHPTVAMELQDLASQIKRLGIQAKITMVDEATKLFTKGFSVSSDYGAGSASPDGEALFSAWHASGSNLVTGAITDANAQTKLLEGIDKLRNVKNDKGGVYRLPKMFTLVCSPENEYIWRKALNNGEYYSSKQDDVALANGVTVNVFTSVDGFKVALLVLESILQPDVDGVAIGTGTESFLLDADRLKMAKALRLIKLYDVEVDDYVDQRTKEYVVDCDFAFTVDHFGAEIGVVWFTWA